MKLVILDRDGVINQDSANYIKNENERIPIPVILECECRKPKPGMLLEIEKVYGTSLEKVYGVGDSLRDLQAFDAIKMQPILVKTGNGQQVLKQKKYPKKTKVFKNLKDATQHIIKSS
ncbi:MAG: HAD hydrolase-like protein [Methylophilaceae bacterium]